jgi:hypothetical protein
MGIERVLGLRAYGVGDTALPNMAAQLAIDYSISKKDTVGIIKAYAQEVELLGRTEGRTAFGVQAAVTRYGQGLDNDSWIRFDKIGGDIANMGRDDWDTFRNRADRLKRGLENWLPHNLKGGVTMMIVVICIVIGVCLAYIELNNRKA